MEIFIEVKIIKGVKRAGVYIGYITTCLGNLASYGVVILKGKIDIFNFYRVIIVNFNFEAHYVLLNQV